MIDLRNVTYTYANGRHPALRQVNWQVDAGEFVLITGASGSGKSTLLRLLNGLVPHFTGGKLTGQALVAGQDVVAVGPAVMSRTVGFVRQTPEAQSVLDRVAAEVAFGLENQAVPAAEMRARVDEALAWLGLEALRHRLIHELSGGEQQKVAIAAALALRPSLLALDEPTSQLDPAAAADLLAILRRLQMELGLTVVLAEHRLDRVLDFGARLLHLADGRVAFDLPIEEAKKRLPPGWMEKFALPTAVSVNGARRDEPLLLLENLYAGYDGRPVLQGVDMRLYPGEAVAVLGRNGAGKSTLLKAIVGLVPITSGRIWVNGLPTAGRETADICRQAGYLPQNPNDLLFAETAAAELAVTWRNHHEPEKKGWRRWLGRGERPLSAQAHAEIADLLTELGLSRFAEAYPRDLSAGQRQRVALGAVAITRPRLLLLDEPTRGLDPAAKASLLPIWRRWLAAGMGLLLVTHDVSLAAQIADRVVQLDRHPIS